MTNDELCKASIYAQDVADHMNVAYWTVNKQPSVFDMKYRHAHDAFGKLAEIMGYKIEVSYDPRTKRLLRPPLS